MRRLRKLEEQNKRVLMRSKAQLPRELLKHISGKEQTVEELHESWFNRVKAKVEFDNKETTFFELAEIIKNEEQSPIGRKFAFVRLFLALMFLSTGNKINLSQETDFKDFLVDLKVKK